MYYLENRIRHGKGGFSPKKGVCRLKVTPIDLLTTTDITVKHRAQSLPVYFYCPRYCCGLDCCELNGSFLAATLGTFAAVLVILSIVCNLECTRSRMRNVWRRITRHKRKVRRINARRMRYGEAMLDSSDFVKKISTRNVVEKPEKKRYSVCETSHHKAKIHRRELARYSTTRKNECRKLMSMPISGEMHKEIGPRDKETSIFR
ncbi:hypothetical protein WR25_18555 isoform D [Diploscapter pachys]|nr:hypothetical protein WR25_18555 isoform D [Diploscapter pachys]